MKNTLTIVFVLISLFSMAQSPGKSVRVGNFYYKRQKLNEAEIKYRQALDKKPDLPQANNNLGNVSYRQGNFDLSASHYLEAIKNTKDPKRLSDYYYNMGNAYYKQNNLESSIEAFKNALRNNPENEDARHNLFLAQQQLNQQKQNKNQQDKNQPKNQEPSEYAKELKKKAQVLINERKYNDAYNLMVEGEKNDETVAYFRTFTDRIKEVSDVNNQD